MDEDVIKKVTWIIILGIGSLFLGGYLFNEWDKEHGDFYAVTNQMKISGKLKILRRYKGITYIELSTGEKFSLQPLRNNLYSPSSIYETIGSGDSIYKSKGSDSIFIKRFDGNVYWYLNQ